MVEHGCESWSWSRTAMGKFKGWGNKSYEEGIRGQNERRRNLGWLLHKGGKNGKNHLEEDAITFCKNTKAPNMTVDPTNHTRWKHKRTWHTPGCVWDKRASDWPGAEDCSEKKETFKQDGHARLRDLSPNESEAPPDNIGAHHAVKVPPCKCAGTAALPNNGSAGTLRWRRSAVDNLAAFGTHCTFGGKRTFSENTIRKQTTWRIWKRKESRR